MLDLSNPNLELLKIQVQNYSCFGCSSCSKLTNYDLRTKSGIINYLIAKRNCYLTKLETKIGNLNAKKEQVKAEIASYQDFLTVLEN